MLTYSDEGGVQKKFARRRNDQIGMPELKFFKVKKNKNTRILYCYKDFHH